MFRIALANIRFPDTPDDSVTLAEEAIAQARRERARIICFPECFVPGYRGLGKQVPPPNAAFLERAWSNIAAAAAEANLAVILGTERVVDDAVLISALVLNRDGTIAGFQDKVQLDPSEDTIYSPGAIRNVFETDGVKFGVVICHEGWRYPETVRWAVRRGAQIVFILTFINTSQANICRRLTRIPLTHSTRRQHCVAQLKTTATSRL